MRPLLLGRRGAFSSGMASYPSASYPSAPPLIITSGGVYEGYNWTSTVAGTPCIRIATTAPVTIRNAAVTKLVGGDTPCIDALYAGANVTIENVRGEGKRTVPNLENGSFFIWTESHAQLTVRNCTLINLRGIQINGPCLVSATTTITRNRVVNIQGYIDNIPTPQDVIVGNFVQFRSPLVGTHSVTWNEILGDYNACWAEDLISVRETSDLTVADNWFGHHSTPGNVYATPQLSSQGSITIEGPPYTIGRCNNVQVLRNHIVDGFGVVAYSTDNLLVQNNRIISDRTLADTGLNKSNGLGFPFTVVGSGINNHFHDNLVAWVDRNGSGGVGNPGDYNPADYLNETPEGGVAEAAKNTFAMPTRAMELAEWTTWQAKLVSNGIAIGAL